MGSVSAFLSHHVCIIAFRALLVNQNVVLKKYYLLGFCPVILGYYKYLMSNETWQSTQCLAQEEAAVGAIYTRLTELGYRTTTVVSHTRSIWRRGHHQVVVSLVDDAWDCALDRGQDTPYLFDADTMVVTDNRINTPTVYQVARLPDSFYGIYSYVPNNQTWAPDRDYTFAVNRIDFRRMRILLNLHQHLGIDQGHVNFNCVLGRNSDPKQVFDAQLIHATEQELPMFRQLSHMMPLKNYSIAHDQTYTHSWLNIMVETYSSDNVVSISEKIFRCLVTPVPWIAYSGRYTVARLRSLGFDVLDDVVDHSYDRLIEAHHKTSGFVSTARDTITELKTHDWATLKQRCQSAATHNQLKLAKLKQCWDDDFAAWLPKNII